MFHAIAKFLLWLIETLTGDLGLQYTSILLGISSLSSFTENRRNEHIAECKRF